MNIPDLLGQARQMHLQLLTDTGIVERQGIPTVDKLGTEHPLWRPVNFDPTVDELGTEHPVWEPVDYALPMLVQHVTRLASGATSSAGEPVLVVDHVAKLPMETDVQLGDRITVTASLDPANLGQWFVTEVELQGWAITRRVHLERTWHSPSTPRN